MVDHAAPERPFGLDTAWRAWIAENLACDVPGAEVVETLVRRGIPPDRAAQYVRDESALRSHRSGSDVDLLRTLAAVHNENADGIDRLDASTPGFEDRFFSGYYRFNAPVVLTGFARGSPVMRWDLPALVAAFGDLSVLVQTNRGADQVDAFRRGKQRRMLLGDYLRSIGSADGNATYLTGNDRALAEPGLERFARDLFFDSRVLDPKRTATHANLWIGGTGATSPLHCDRVNVLNLQVAGRKTFRLAHPGSMPDVYAIRGMFSVVDALAPDLDRFPDFTRVRLFEVTLEPGDALLIPVGWWHHVAAVEPSVNVSFTNFTAGNTYAAQGAAANGAKR